jgi:hypothetical protein
MAHGPALAAEGAPDRRICRPHLPAGAGLS